MTPVGVGNVMTPVGVGHAVNQITSRERKFVLS
jgi:hypothetical protein